MTRPVPPVRVVAGRALWVPDVGCASVVAPVPVAAGAPEVAAVVDPLESSRLSGTPEVGPGVGPSVGAPPDTGVVGDPEGVVAGR